MNILLDDKARHLRQTGYGRVAMTVADGLIRGGHNHVAAPYEPFEGYELSPIDNGFFHYDPKALNQLSDFDLSVAVGNPDSTKRLNLPSLMYTMVDTSDIPDSWVSKLSKMDGFLTPASRVTNIFNRHYYGFDVDSLVALFERHKLKVIKSVPGIPWESRKSDRYYLMVIMWMRSMINVKFWSC